MTNQVKKYIFCQTQTSTCHINSSVKRGSNYSDILQKKIFEDQPQLPRGAGVL